jgi:DNA-directed RNA polymerase subunit RPC12/RpoP
MAWKPRAAPMSKAAMREETARLMKEAKNIVVTQGKTRMEVRCSKCGVPNRVLVESGQSRVEYSCKECGHKQRTL